MDFFVVKKILGALMMPLSVALMLLLLAIVTHKKRPRFSFISLCFGFMVLFIASFPPVVGTSSRALENNFEAFTRAPDKLDYIVILGCYHVDDYALPYTSQLDICSLTRLVEAIRISHIHPEAQLIASGFAPRENGLSNAEAVQQAAISLGIAEEKFTVAAFSRDTEEEAAILAPKIRGTNIAVVTSAVHMQRTMNYFHQNEVYPIAAPASPWSKRGNQPVSWKHFVPEADALEQATYVWYESLGLAYQWLKK